ncbi:hypothetical protein [Stieleria varia]|uniref:Peptidoglycan binding-like domain-containing protein n=1 Tax=Stieleria varia TaxID=2528005 RepID=A0A5C6ARN9_9BACT|nr:hypothetical protein [Stieleria varia]TWU02238.1 hypothetical protein Pla52n_32880 [Stieleria varia]
MRIRSFHLAILAALLSIGLLSAKTHADGKQKTEDCKECDQQTAGDVSGNQGDKKPKNSGDPKEGENEALPVKAQIELLTNELAQLPPNPKAGECYIRVRQAAKYKTVEQKVLVKAASVRYEITPAKFKDVEKKVLVRPETVRYQVVPAKYETKKVTVVLSPEHEELIAVETKFENKKSKIETKPERVEWKRGSGLISKEDLTHDGQPTTDILCLVREPAEFHEYTEQVIAEKAKVERKEINAQEQVVETTVLVSPAQVKEIKEPAEYKTIKVRELVSSASEKRVDVPAEYETVKRQVLLHPETLVWQRVLCNTNITPEILKRIQKALKDKGFDPKTDKATWNRPMQHAVERYQHKHKLATGGLTYEFLEHIGVNP